MTIAWMVGLPVAGALLIFLSPQNKGGWRLALAVSLADLFICLRYFLAFDPFNGGFQFEERLDLGAWLGFHDSLGLDGVSLGFALLTAFLMPLCVAGDLENRRGRRKTYYACLLLLESAALAAFTATDLFLFFLAWEAVLVCLFYLFRYFGSSRRAPAAFQFVFFQTVGSLLLLGSFLAVVRQAHTFDYGTLLDQPLPEDLQFWCFLALTAAFLIQVPLPPFHSWMSDLYAEAPLGGAFVLGGIFSSLGVYGLVRFCVPLFPTAAKAFGPWLLLLGLAAAYYGSLRALSQEDPRRLAASLTLSQAGFILLGIFSFSLTGFQGALLETFGLAVSLAGFWTVMGWVLARRRGRAPGHFGGWITQTPRLALVFLVSLLGLAAFPGLGLFGGFYLVLLSVYRASPVLGLAAVGAFVISAWPLALLFKKIFLGPPPAGTPARVPDLGVREALVFLPLFLASVWIGVGPNQFLQPMEKSVQLNVLQRLNALPAMMDFAAYQRMLQDERQKAGKPPAGP